MMKLRHAINHWLFGVIVLISTLGVGSAKPIAMGDGQVFPPPSPVGESPALDELPTVASCKSMVSKLAVSKSWRLNSQLVTKSDRWGVVLRVDFEMRVTAAPRVNRIICWRTPSGKHSLVYVIGQDLPRLSK